MTHCDGQRNDMVTKPTRERSAQRRENERGRGETGSAPAMTNAPRDHLRRHRANDRKRQQRRTPSGVWIGQHAG